jgi:hypothetical protein
MKALLAVLGTSFAVNLCLNIVQVACHEKDEYSSNCIKKGFCDTLFFLLTIRTHRTGKICRHENQGVKLYSDYMQLEMFMKNANPTILSDSIVPSFSSRARVLDISFLMGFTCLSPVQGWQRGRMSDKGFLLYPYRRFS